MSSVHAEENAIRKLPSLPRQKKLKKIDLLVIKVGKNGTLGSSKPCYNCIIKLAISLPEKGYILNKIYYSTRNSDIESCKLTDLIHEENPHVSKFYKNVHKTRKENTKI